MTNNKYNTSENGIEKIDNPCKECDHHLAGNSKECEQCYTCLKRIAYNDYIDRSFGKFPVQCCGHSVPRKTTGQNNDMPPEPLFFQEEKEKKRGRKPTIPREIIKAEYVQMVVTKKMTLKALAKKHHISIESVRRIRKQEKWPPVKQLK